MPGPATSGSLSIASAKALCRLARSPGRRSSSNRRPRQRVAEGIAPAGLIDDEELMIDRLAQGLVELGVGQPGNRCE